MKIINPFSREDQLSRLAAMVDIGIERNQKEIFQKLLSVYQKFENPRIVALTMDMDYMGGGDAIDDFITQTKTVAEIKTQFPDQLIAFYGVDPRRPNAFDLLKENVENYGFTGIKLYPALGFFPFDKRLRKVYEYAIEKSLPIMTHADIGGIFYRGNLKSEHLLPLSINPIAPTRSFTEHMGLKKSEFKDFFSDPQNFEEVLQMPDFRDLKVCFAHYGGGEMIDGVENASPTGTNWYNTIKRLLLEYPNTYTDVSYTLHHSNKKIVSKVLNDIRDPKLNHKILFGTDYYMTSKVKEEESLIAEFIKNYGLSKEEFFDLSVRNNSNYLSTSFFKL
ncbi:amidohydrolase family protein [Algoriphagus sp. D3-2-R+10]|nr:amidohydrolase family protein [Algoriphagus sp. D3-2-R+10]